MSAKTTGTIWDLRLTVPQRMVLLAMVDHADHDGEHIHAPVPFIAWKTGYSSRNVSRIIQDLLASGVLVLTESSRGEANEYCFDFSRATLKPPYRGRKPQRKRATPDKMSPPTHDKMSGVQRPTPDKMAVPPDKMSPPTHDKMAIDHDLPYKKDHEPPPPPTNDMASGGGGGVEKKPNKTELYHWLCANGVDSPQAAERNQHHDLAATQALYRTIVGDAIGDERKKRIGRFIRKLDADGPPPIASSKVATIADYPRPAPLPTNALAPEAARDLLVRSLKERQR